MRNSTDYKLAGPKTFRRASKQILPKKVMFMGKMKVKGWGSNLQNIEKSAREMYYPDGFTSSLTEKCLYWLKTGDTDVFTEEELLKLRVMLQCDQSGAEALGVAYLCEARDYRKLFECGVKVHVYVAMKLFKDVWTKKMKEHGGLIEDFNIESISTTPIEKLKQNPFWKDLDLLIKSSDNWSLQERYYYLAKQTVHSANYAITAQTFRMNILQKSGGKIIISLKDAEFFLDTYRSLFPEIVEWNKRVAQQVEQTRILYNLHGHPYTITDWHLDESSMKEYIAWSPQSTIGEITRIAFTNLQHYIEDTKQPWDLLQDNHDSYMAQCPLIYALDCQGKMQGFMQQEMTSPVDGVKFRMKSDVNIGFNWAPAKPEKNENLLGLREIHWN